MIVLSSSHADTAIHACSRFLVPPHCWCMARAAATGAIGATAVFVFAVFASEWGRAGQSGTLLVLAGRAPCQALALPQTDKLRRITC